MTSILENIVQSPKFKDHFEWLRNYIKEEQQKRKNFYDFVTEDMKAEFINGEVIIHSPVAYEHEMVSSELQTLFNVYIFIHNLGRVTHEKLMISLTRNDYEQDICFLKKKTLPNLKKGKSYFLHRIWW